MSLEKPKENASLWGGVCVCVPLEVTGILLDCAVFVIFAFSRGITHGLDW